MPVTAAISPGVRLPPAQGTLYDRTKLIPPPASDGPDSFVLMSARSSARSFFHAVKTSIDNIG